MGSLKEKIVKTYYDIGSISFIRNRVKNYQGKISILMYHRVLPESEHKADLAGNSVSLTRFEEQIRFISENYSPIPIDELINPTIREFPKTPVVITFDDGYKDNLTYAFPVLRKFNVPATLYVTTRFLEGDCQMWWYELFEFFKDRTELTFSFKNQKHYFSLKNPLQRTCAFKKLKKMILTLNGKEQNELLTILRNGHEPLNFDQYCLNCADINKLGQEPLITIGAHTHSHFNLKALNNDEAFHEIALSKQILEQKLNRPIHHFAYPYGGNGEAGKREFSIVERLNFKTAVTTCAFSLKDGFNAFSLPRHAIRDRHDGKLIDIKLSGWNAFWKQQV